ncbi:hypothetical protein LEAN103870_09795 [Legionella anisa]|uniref:Uncharacterized protein n=1 Tax=Legionella anisa TaxID=28082 RepID=A0AAX0WVY9_9GAMM|nr:hypothetical protein [Legionella anisa]AWN73352.1 hypothetical protein DLD14_05575 [Legionella anisa]KTC67378.1 hypothetical protein Lani_3723 [Legionella anisa]MBN5934135.1 hypothetical protein [Legionella anisa]MCW8426214.1 hypothetical protein [Legionella anisa]MCW8447876.1 hypothetical protein [Legionella anisa]
MNRIGICAFLLSVYCSAFGFADVVPAKPSHYGPGKIQSSEAKNYANQSVVACGRATNPINRLNGINIGEPGLDGMIGADLIMILPQSISNSSYYGKLLCVSGVVRMMPVNNSPPVPTITVGSEKDIEILPNQEPTW